MRVISRQVIGSELHFHSVTLAALIKIDLEEKEDKEDTS